MIVDKVMTRRLVTISATDSVKDAFNIMQALDCRHLLVTEGKDLVGIISDRDLLASSNNSSIPDIEVNRVMTTNILTCTQSCLVGDIIDIMLNNKIDALPVMGPSSELRGIVTSSDLLELLKNSEDLTNSILPINFQFLEKQTLI